MSAAKRCRRSTKTARCASSARSRYYSDNHFEADGIYREFYPNGKLFVEGKFSNGRQDGEWTFYFENGQLNRKATYKDGQPDGAWDVFRADGTLVGQAQFRNGQRDGEWITYDETGRSRCAKSITSTARRTAFGRSGIPTASRGSRSASSRASATARAWNGTKRARSASKSLTSNGKLHGTATLWLTDGRKIVQKYEDGKLVSQSTSD